MGLTRSEIVKKRASVCSCGKLPVWATLTGGTVVLACPDLHCDLYLAVKGHSISEAVETWNQEVEKHVGSRKGN